jgi:indolepyruvate ferredoxin oxidoreductase
MSIANVSLDDKYRLERGTVFLTGMQALARLPMLQHELDRRAGLHTAGYVSGYRGSPLGGLDFALHAAAPFLKPRDISFQPGLNEDIAATAVWGTQQLHLFPQPKYDGIFSMWYGKGPGVDRSGDVFRHANHAGTSKHGGVLLIAGDDPSARSSAVAHQSEHIFSACGIPVLAPANLQEYLDYGLHGWAMSRYSGCWVAHEADLGHGRKLGRGDGRSRPPRAHHPHRLPAAGRRRAPALARSATGAGTPPAAVQGLCRDRLRPRQQPQPPDLRQPAAAAGHHRLRQGLHGRAPGARRHGIDAAHAAEIGLRLFKVGMPWPLEAESVRRFAEGLEEILVVEEKRQIIEYQLKEMLYNWREDVRPRVVGKYDETGEWPLPEHRWLLPPTAELTPAIVARAIAARIGRFHTSPRIADHIAFLDARAQAQARPRVTLRARPTSAPAARTTSRPRCPKAAARWAASAAT